MKLTTGDGFTINVMADGGERDLVSYSELPDSVRGDFSYVVSDRDGWADYRFFHYRGDWYDAGDAERLFVAGDWVFGFTLTPQSAVVFKYATTDKGDAERGRVIVGYAVGE